MRASEVEVPQLEDAKLSLAKWRALIERLIAVYGEKAVLRVDAGHNNVSFYVARRGKVQSRE